MTRNASTMYYEDPGLSRSRDCIARDSSCMMEVPPATGEMAQRLSKQLEQAAGEGGSKQAREEGVNE